MGAWGIQTVLVMPSWRPARVGPSPHRWEGIEARRSHVSFGSGRWGPPFRICARSLKGVRMAHRGVPGNLLGDKVIFLLIPSLTRMGHHSTVTNNPHVYSNPLFTRTV